MSLGEIREPSMVFGDGKKRTHRKASWRAAIVRWAMARQDLGDNEIESRELTTAKVQALRLLVADGSALAVHCDVLLCRLSRSDAEVANGILAVVDAINTRVGSRSKES